MIQVTELLPEFVEFIPPSIESGTIYISMAYGTAIHKCCCGCGEKVVTPFSPTDWKIVYNGDSVSLSPSIGNWNFPCKSHYWIEENRIRWAAPWSQKEITAGRKNDWLNKSMYFGLPKSSPKTTWVDGVWKKLKKVVHK